MRSTTTTTQIFFPGGKESQGTNNVTTFEGSSGAKRIPPSFLGSILLGLFVLLSDLIPAGPVALVMEAVVAAVANTKAALLTETDD